MDFQLNKYDEDTEALIEEKIVECTFSIIYDALYRNIDIDLITYTNEKIKLHGKNPSNFKDFLELSTRIKPVKEVCLGDLIESESRILSLGTTLIVVTPKTDPKTISKLIALKEKGHTIILILVNNFTMHHHLNKRIPLLEKMGIRVYKVDLQDDINYVLR